jgi:hypothetical protein
MLQLPMITPRSGRFLIALFLVIKLAMLVWNADMFDGKPYDVLHHSDRALFGGLRAGKMAYNPPPYYFPALLLTRPAEVPLVERSSETVGEDQEAVRSRLERAVPFTRAEKLFRAKLIDVLRYTNIFWLSLFYVIWVYYAFPRLLRGFQPWFLACLLLLVLPGYQKLGVMTHPDNMFAGTAAVAVAVWLFLCERWQRGRADVQNQPPAMETTPAKGAGLRFWHLIAFATMIGLMALTRPFAIVPTAVLSIVCVVYAVRSVGGNLLRLLPRLLLLGTIISVMSLSWYVYRWKTSGEVTNAYRTSYVARFEKRRANFDYKHYYTSLNLKDLIRDPSRKTDNGDSSGYDDTRLGNSFFTLLYSEIWGDQWLYFSGPRMTDNKAWPKRVLLTCALAVPSLALALGAMSLWDLVGRIRKKVSEVSPKPLLERVSMVLTELERELVLLAIVLLGAALFVYWQGGPALLPGKNSTVKFIYIATLFPPAIALLFTHRLEPIAFNLVSGYFILLFIVAFPVAMYWPR